MPSLSSSFFFFADTATTEIYTLSLHDALPIWTKIRRTRIEEDQWIARVRVGGSYRQGGVTEPPTLDRKSTRLNSSHTVISYAVFCLKKKKKNDDDRGTSKRTETSRSQTCARRA